MVLEKYFYIKTKINNLYFRKKIRTLVKNGAEIGEKCIWYSSDIFVDPTRPYLLHIGDYCKITKGVIILTHDYSLSVLRRVYGEWIGEGSETYIGDNCFIGMNSILLMGTRLGNNCIVGAGSVVHGTFPDNCVIAGNPARIICTLHEHYEKRKLKTIEEAKDVARIYKKRFNTLPTPKELVGFRFLFIPRDYELLKKYEIYSFECNGDEPKEVEKAFFDSEPYWDDFESFINETFM